MRNSTYQRVRLRCRALPIVLRAYAHPIVRFGFPSRIRRLFDFVRHGTARYTARYGRGTSRYGTRTVLRGTGTRTSFVHSFIRFPFPTSTVLYEVLYFVLVHSFPRCVPFRLVLCRIGCGECSYGNILFSFLFLRSSMKTHQLAPP